MELKKEAFVKAYRETLGVIKYACEQVSISRRTFYNWLEADEEFRQAVEDVNEEGLDFAENALKKKIREGDTTSIIFYLKTKGKKRGYIERTEIDATIDERQREIEELARKFYSEE